jgi:predicted RNA-binding Zn-ribbon protein involved in translation (DUF1610 family)
MATYKLCKKCGKFVEYRKKIEFEFGNEKVSFECPECGNVENTSISHVHYGNDAIKK